MLLCFTLLSCIESGDEERRTDEVDEDHSDIEVVPEASKNCEIDTEKSVVTILIKIFNQEIMTSQNQVKSLHLFHSVATPSRVETWMTRNLLEI